MKIQADRMRARRKSVGLTQIQLAKLVGCTNSYISHIEKKKANPSVQCVLLIAIALNMNLQDLLEEE